MYWKLECGVWTVERVWSFGRWIVGCGEIVGVLEVGMWGVVWWIGDAGVMGVCIWEWVQGSWGVGRVGCDLGRDYGCSRKGQWSVCMGAR